MPHIKKVNSLQESCLKSIAFNIDKWKTFQNVETAGDQKVEHLDVKGPLDAVSTVQIMDVNLHINLRSYSGENH